MNKLLILAAEAAKYTSLITASNLGQLEIRTASDVETARLMVADCNIILGDPPLISEVLGYAGLLEWVQSAWAGVDDLCRQGLRKDYVLTGVKGVFGSLISEYVMTYLFAIERGLFVMRGNQMDQCWKPLAYRPTQDITLGIVGLGSIGQHLASAARFFGIRVTGLNLSGRPCDHVEKVYTMDDPGVFFEEADYLVLTLPGTPQTKNFINSNVLGKMKPSAVLMNVGRGSVIQETDLVDALREGIIAGAVLDVFAVEPLPKDSPLWRMPNVFVTPHTAANSFPEDIVSIFSGNYLRFLRQEPLLNSINFESGY